MTKLLMMSITRSRMDLPIVVLCAGFDAILGVVLAISVRTITGPDASGISGLFGIIGTLAGIVFVAVLLIGLYFTLIYVCGHVLQGKINRALENSNTAKARRLLLFDAVIGILAHIPPIGLLIALTFQSGLLFSAVLLMVHLLAIECLSVIQYFSAAMMRRGV